MIKDSHKNVALTLEQLQQLDVYETRLKNIEAETVIANKALNVTQKEVVKATKEREYQEELSANLTSEVAKLKTEKMRLTEEKASLEDFIDRTNREIKEASAETDTKRKEVDTREKALREREHAFEDRIRAFNAEAVCQDEDRQVISRAKDAFVKAVETVTWKSSKE